ncbi:MAG: SDR family oxidoreductase, partial [Planctomycetota bacterium]
PDGERVLTRHVDVSDAESVEAFAEAVVERFGRIDLWINNAGVLEPMGPLRDVEAVDLTRALDVNVVGVFHGSRWFARHVRARPGDGVLVNISSGAAQRPYAGWGAYCASKAAVERLTECLALEEADAGLRCYSVAPGVVDTDMQALIRSCPPERFPMVERFHRLKAEDAFNSPAWIAAWLLRAAFDPAHRPDAVATRVPNER